MPLSPPNFEIVLPRESWDKFEEIADRHQMLPIQLIQKFFKIGFLFYNILEDPNASLIIREGDSEREITLD